MNTSEIRKLARRNPITAKTFKGVYAADQLPQKGRTKGVYIINLDPSHKPGSHWIAVEIAKQSSARSNNFYFDSYGLPPTDKRIKCFLGKRFRFNAKILQHLLSTACGQWCLYFLLRRAQTWPATKIFRHFDNEGSLANDYAINHFVQKNYKTNNLKVIDRDFLKEQLCEGEQSCKQMKVNLRESKKKNG